MRGRLIALVTAVILTGCSSTPIATGAPSPSSPPTPGISAPASSLPAPSNEPSTSVAPAPSFAPPTSWQRVPDAALLHLDATSNSVVAVAPDGTFVAIQSALDAEAPVVFHSTDGLAWTKLGSLPASQDSQVNAITNAGHGLLAVGLDPGGAAWTSVDGHAWQRERNQASLASEEFERVAARPNEIVAVLGSGLLASSPDGLSWSAFPIDGTDDAKVSDIAVTDAGFIAVGRVGTRAAAWTSSDGRSWQPAAFPENADASAELISVAVDGRRVVALGAVASAGDAERSPGDLDEHVWTAMRAWWSVDGGATWARSADAAPDLYAPSIPRLFAGWGGFVALGNPGPGGIAVWTTPDGSVWQQSRIHAGDDVWGKSLAISGSFAVIGGRTVGTGAGGDRAVFWTAQR